MRSRQVLHAFVLGATSLALAGCGGSSSDDDLSQQSITEKAREVRKALLSESEIRRAPGGAPGRAFLEYWSDIQYGDGVSAIKAYDRELVATVGSKLLYSALRNAESIYRGSKPDVTRVRTARGVTTIRYFAPTINDGSEPSPLSIRFRRLGGQWRIVFNAVLNDELRAAAQEAEQNKIKPSAQQLDPRAVAAGERAADLQSRYLARKENSSGSE